MAQGGSRVRAIGPQACAGHKASMEDNWGRERGHATSVLTVVAPRRILLVGEHAKRDLLAGDGDARAPLGRIRLVHAAVHATPVRPTAQGDSRRGAKRLQIDNVSISRGL